MPVTLPVSSALALRSTPAPFAATYPQQFTINLLTGLPVALPVPMASSNPQIFLTSAKIVHQIALLVPIVLNIAPTSTVLSISTSSIIVVLVSVLIITIRIVL